MSSDPYANLGISPNATPSELKRAYRMLARKYHPDVCPGDADAARRFARARAAFDLLRDPKKRASYDRGEIDTEGKPKSFVFQDVTDVGGSGKQPDSFESIFKNAFGYRAQPAAKGEDWRYTIKLDFLEAVTGCTRRLKVSGNIAFDLRIPAGVADAQTLRIKGKGHPSIAAGPPGDALITVRVGAHASFSRRDNDIRMDARVSLTEAIEGGKITIATPTGPLSVTVPPGAGSGDVLRLKGKGVQKKPPGDLLVRLFLIVPEAGRDELRAFLKTWSARSVTPDR